MLVEILSDSGILSFSARATIFSRRGRRRREKINRARCAQEHTRPLTTELRRYFARRALLLLRIVGLP